MEATLNLDSACDISSKIFVANATANNPQLEESFCILAGIIVTESFPIKKWIVKSFQTSLCDAAKRFVKTITNVKLIIRIER